MTLSSLSAQQIFTSVKICEISSLIGNLFELSMQEWFYNLPAHIFITIFPFFELS